ncbi:MAG: hypothetical protein IPL12_22180 [Bacteroidetes bacterium]|nr:hypothetical protein [Bacteroidota bacterium]
MLRYLFAQTAAPTSNTTTATEQATPVIKAADVTTNTVKCSSETKTGACCSHGASKAEAATSTEASNSTSTESATTSEAATTGENCKSVSVGVSAAKPEAMKVDETPDN